MDSNTQVLNFQIQYVIGSHIHNLYVVTTKDSILFSNRIETLQLVWFVSLFEGLILAQD